MRGSNPRPPAVSIERGKQIPYHWANDAFCFDDVKMSVVENYNRTKTRTTARKKHCKPLGVKGRLGNDGSGDSVVAFRRTWRDDARPGLRTGPYCGAPKAAYLAGTRLKLKKPEPKDMKSIRDGLLSPISITCRGLTTTTCGVRAKLEELFFFPRWEKRSDTTGVFGHGKRLLSANCL